MSELPDEDQTEVQTQGQNQSQTEKPKATNFDAERKAIFDKCIRMSKAELIKSELLVKYPDIAKAVNEYRKGQERDRALELDSSPPVQSGEERVTTGQRPQAEFTKDKVTEMTQTVDQKLRERIQLQKDSYIRRVAATGKATIKIFGFRDGDTDVWFKMDCNYRDLMESEANLLQRLRAIEVDIRRQLDYYDITRGKKDADYNHIMEQLVKAMYNTRQKTLELYYGVSETDFMSCHKQDVDIALQAARYREENLYPNFQTTSSDFY